MHPHRKPNWPSLLITLALLATVVAIYLAWAMPAIRDLHGSLGG